MKRKYSIVWLTMITIFLMICILSCKNDDDGTIITPVSTEGPNISDFTPTLAEVGAEVTITGTNFSTTTTNNKVAFNGIAATVTTATATSLKAKVPEGATTGKITIKVGEREVTSATDFIVVLPPTVTTFSPEIGAAGTEIIIAGTNFSTSIEDNEVKFNETVAIVSEATETELTVTVPEGATTGKISVKVGNNTATSTSDFTVEFPPKITSFVPTSGEIGTEVVITGENFSATAADNEVKIGETSITVSAATTTSLTITIPNNAIGGKISVTTDSKTGESDEPFTVTNIWIEKADFGGVIRDRATGFSLKGKGYVGLGLNRDTNNKTRDFWEYDPVQDTWTQKADFGGLPRDQAVAFAIESKGKGYIGTGWTDSNFANDLWEYDPDTNAWTRKADFGGGARANAVGFSIGNKGYIGTGLGPDIFTRNKDLWEYNPDTDMWTKKADFGGVGITRGTGFAIGDKGYIGLGEDAGFTRRKDFWEYDPTTDQWSQITDFGGNGRHQAIGFAIGNKGYCGLGTPGQSDKDFWEYSPQMNTWTQVADYGGGNRNNVIGFSINNKGYIGTGLGRSGTGPGTTTFGTKDFWEYVPNAN